MMSDRVAKQPNGYISVSKVILYVLGGCVGGWFSSSMVVFFLIRFCFIVVRLGPSLRQRVV